MDIPRERNLVFDVGLHVGEDTDFYLKKGFRVVAIEANPELVEKCKERFSSAIADGRLCIVWGAIIDPDSKDVSDSVRFFKNDRVSEWGTICPDWVERNRTMGTESMSIEVPALDFSRVLRDHGIPYYLKIDIEGADLYCLQALHKIAPGPAYVSLESSKTGFSHIVAEIDLLQSLGYTGFQAVEQSSLSERQTMPEISREGKSVAHVFPPGASGLFGRDLPDDWKDRKAILRQYRAIDWGYRLLGDSGVMRSWHFLGAWGLRGMTARCCSLLTKAPVPGWYDTHARHADWRQWES